jgi:hypothetical protein
MVLVNEGEFKLAPPGEDLAHVGINSCVSITITYANGQRIGGHASVAPGLGQQGLQGVLMGMLLICVIANALNPQALYVIGDLGSWPGRPGWPATGATGLRATLALPVNVPVTVRDTYVLNGNHSTTVNATFGQHPARVLMVDRTSDGAMLINGNW